MHPASRLHSLSSGFTLVGALGSMAVLAAVAAICVPLVVSRLRAHAQTAEQAVHQAAAAITGGLNQVTASAAATASELASTPAVGPGGGEASPAWPAGPIEPLWPAAGLPGEWGWRPDWPPPGSRPARFWRPRFHPRPLEWRWWPRPPVWRQP